MTVSTSNSYQSFPGGQSVLTFNFRTLYSNPSYVQVNVITSGTIVPLVYNVGYTVNVNASGIGGTVTVSPTYSSDCTYVVYRQTGITQASAYTDYNQFPASTLENNLDQLTMVDQEINTSTGQALTLPLGISPTASTILPIPSGSTVIGWNATGTGLVNYYSPLYPSPSVYPTGQVVIGKGTAIPTSGTSLIVSGGNVGIGTSSPATLLDVSGGAITARNGVVATGTCYFRNVGGSTNIELYDTSNSTYADLQLNNKALTIQNATNDLDVYSNAWADYSATSTIVGFSSFTTKAIYTKKIGKTVFVKYQLDGVSNSATTYFTVPYTSANDGAETRSCAGLAVDNGTAQASPASAVLAANATTVYLQNQMSTGTWTTSGTKQVRGEFWYQSS